jgi:hypothetical protein
MLKRSRFTGLTLLLMGSMFLFWYLTQPRVQMLHGADIVGLTGCGACLGVGITGLIGRLRLPEK